MGELIPPDLRPVSCRQPILISNNYSLRDCSRSTSVSRLLHIVVPTLLDRPRRHTLLSSILRDAATGLAAGDAQRGAVAALARLKGPGIALLQNVLAALSSLSPERGVVAPEPASAVSVNTGWSFLPPRARAPTFEEGFVRASLGSNRRWCPGASAAELASRDRADQAVFLITRLGIAEG